jgi:hypothetical protein
VWRGRRLPDQGHSHNLRPQASLILRGVLVVLMRALCAKISVRITNSTTIGLLNNNDNVTLRAYIIPKKQAH